jgi:NAD(P)H-dependent flavin oxidoreductase YrpB (nitropropane dioxygenase family)
MSLGADGIAMGTRFAVTEESPLAEATKLAIVQVRVLHRKWLPSSVVRSARGNLQQSAANEQGNCAVRDFGFGVWGWMSRAAVQWGGLVPHQWWFDARAQISNHHTGQGGGHDLHEKFRWAVREGSEDQVCLETTTIMPSDTGLNRDHILG